MLVERIEGKWIEAFARVFEMCAADETQSAAILSETQSRNVNVNLAELGLDRLGVRPIHIAPVSVLHADLGTLITGGGRVPQNELV